MSVAISGQVHGNTITLDHSLPQLEGQRVRVVIEPAENIEQGLSPEQQTRLWQTWIEQGPQGPILEEDETFP